MKITWERDREIITVTIDGKTTAIHCWSKVRNELNNTRSKLKKSDVVRTTNADDSEGVPYMPRPFPLGEWEITGIVTHLTAEDKEQGYLYPLFIMTTAKQQVMEWSLKPDETYDKPTGRMVWDYAYGIHWAEKSTTTLGCGRVDTEKNIRWLAAQIETAMAAKEKITLEVI